MSEEENKAEAAAEKKPAKKAPAKKAAEKDAKPAAKAEAKKAAPKKEKKESGVKKTGKLIDDVRLYDVIVRPVVTEKSTLAAEQGKVVFKISPTATKTQVKAAVEQLFNVKVTKVNTVLTKGKTKRFRGQTGRRSDQRKAIVTLAEGQTIDIAAGVK
jgi:large subunit ribosomal protein L23